MSMILLDSVLSKAKENYPSRLKEDEVFELYCADNILINYDLDYAEIESGVVDGPRDAGIDAVYIFVNSQLVTEDLDLSAFGNRSNWNYILSRRRMRIHSKKVLSTSWLRRYPCCSIMQRNRKSWSPYLKKKLLRSAGHF